MRWLVYFIFTLVPLGAWAGVHVGNGGDAIYCKPDPSNDLNGYYSLDYILTLQAAKGDDGVAPISSWKASSERIFKNLLEKVPSLAPSFKEFSRLLYNKSHLQHRVWEPAPFGLVDLNDERITSLLPENCKTDGKFKIIQAVIRLYSGFTGTTPGHIIYKYFPDMLAQMDAQSPVQLSYLLVHEWLWDISNNVDRNRRINRFFHSREFDEMSPAVVAETLKAMGLRIPEMAPDSFDADYWQGYPLTKERFFERFDGFDALFNLGQLKVDFRERAINCPEGHVSCHPGWTKRQFERILEVNRFFLAARFEGENREFPIRIISPELSDRTVGAFGNISEIKCRFVDDPHFNLECRFSSANLVFALLGISVENLPYEEWPKLKASITEEGFRLVTRGKKTWDVSGAGRKPWVKVLETETAFTTRFTWPGVARSSCEAALR